MGRHKTLEQKVKTSIVLDKYQDDYLRALAKKNGKSKSAQIRDLLFPEQKRGE